VEQADVVPVAVNILWAVYDIAALSVLFGALTYHPDRDAQPYQSASSAAGYLPEAIPAGVGSHEGVGAGIPDEA
ncbi:MAG: hypothetical protein ACR2J8_15980, partial [Thermomicrobiales bacterium]